MNKLKYLLFIIPFLFLTNVNAATLTPRSSINNFQDNNRFDYTAVTADDERPQENWTFYGSIGSTYSRKLYGLRAYFNTSLTANHTYRITINTNLNNFNSTGFNYSNAYICFGSSWTGANSNCSSVLGLSSISSNSVSFNFRPTSNYNYFQFRIGPQTDVSYSFTNSYSFNITSFILDDLSSVPTNPSNSVVITNDNKNTSDIITNDNRNTTNILGSITENSQNEININNQNFYEVNQNINNAKSDIIDNQNNSSTKAHNDLTSCSYQTKHFSLYRIGYLGDQGQILSNNSYIISNYIEIIPSDQSVKFDIYNSNNGGIKYGDYCLYDENKTLISCSRLDNENTSNTIYYISNSSARYMRTTLYRSDAVLNNAYITGIICTNKLDDINDNIKDNNNFISDGNVDGSTGSSFFNNFNSQDFGLSEIITIPLNSIQSLTSKTCVPLQVPIPFTNKNISLPCMTEIYESKFSSIYNLWKIVSFGIVAYLIAVDIFHIVKGFKDPESDKVEVLDL